jgi:nucleoside-diphosphate kinase
MERTLAIVKPDGVDGGNVGSVVARIEEEGFRILALRMVRMTRAEAEGFYAVHRGRPFFESLTAYMSSGPAIVLVLERENAIQHWRGVMGATNPADAAEGTLRRRFGTSIERNVVHGSDATATAATEIAYFFRLKELLAQR